MTQQLLGQALPLLRFGPGNAGQELLAVVPQPRGRELAENGTNDKETASGWTRAPGLWSHHLSNWIRPPLKPVLRLSYTEQNIPIVQTSVSFKQPFLVDYVKTARAWTLRLTMSWPG